MLIGQRGQKNASIRRDPDEWFAEEVGYISRKHYRGTTFHIARLLNLDTGERADVVVAADEFYVPIRDMGFEVINLKALEHVVPWEIGLDRVDIFVDTGHTRIDGQLDALILESKKLHEHLSHLYGDE